jgi:hypothetical protein
MVSSNSYSCFVFYSHISTAASPLNYHGQKLSDTGLHCAAFYLALCGRANTGCCAFSAIKECQSQNRFFNRY